MALQHDIARSHLETLIEQLTGIPKAEPDPEGDYALHIAGSGFFARVDGEQPALFRLYSVVAEQLEPSAELFESLNGINLRLSFLRAMYVNGQVMIEGDLLAMTSTRDDFREVCLRIAQASDHFAPQLIDRFGGTPVFEDSKSAGYSTPAPPIPGYL
jgi:hypothetical protein